MMSPIKDFKVVCEALNEEDTFTAGDTVKGTVSFNLTADTKVKSILVKIKGDAFMSWFERAGDRSRSEVISVRYFKEKEYLVERKDEGTILPKGAHHFDFMLQIPQMDLPPSFKGSDGWIIYKAEAEISRSWRLASTEQRILKVVSKYSTQYGQYLQPAPDDQQNGTVVSNDDMKMFVTIDRKVYSPGDTISISAKIHNTTSKETRPKFSLEQKVVHQTNSAQKVNVQSLSKVAGDIIVGNAEENVSFQLKIPVDVTQTYNCDIISIDYYVKAYLDIRFAFDPEVRFPVLIVPRVGSFPAGETGLPCDSDTLPGLDPVVPAPPPNGYPAPGPN